MEDDVLWEETIKKNYSSTDESGSSAWLTKVLPVPSYLCDEFIPNYFNTTEQQLHNIPNRRPTKQEIWFKDTPEDGARLVLKHIR
jgi:hypothetical protein